MKKLSFYRSVQNALRGVGVMIRSERNFQIEVLALLLNVFLIIFLKLSPTHSAMILMVCFAVLSAEMLNTAIEKLCDFVHPDFSKSIGIIKDLAAGAVVLLASISVIVGVLIYSQYIFI